MVFVRKIISFIYDVTSYELPSVPTTYNANFYIHSNNVSSFFSSYSLTWDNGEASNEISQFYFERNLYHCRYL